MRGRETLQTGLQRAIENRGFESNQKYFAANYSTNYTLLFQRKKKHFMLGALFKYVLKIHNATL